MTAVHFAAFVERLAQVSGEAIFRFFLSAIRAEDKSLGGRVRSGHRGGPGRRAAMAADLLDLSADGVSESNMGATGPRRNMSGSSIRSTAPKVFVSGLPTWGTLIGLMYRGRPVYGMMAQPFTRERFYGYGKPRARARSRRRAATRRPRMATRAMRTRPCASLGQATLARLARA